jgi:hexosaminidase
MARVISGGIAVVVLVLAAIGTAVMVLAQPTGDRAEPGAPPGSSPAAPTEEPAATPTGPTDEPRVIPAVRSWEGEEGTGWEPTDSTRVIADEDGPLADAATRLAEELSVPVSAEEARPGDVILRLRPGAKLGPEDYQLVSRDGRVTITGSAEAGVFYGTRTLVQAVRDRGGVAEGVIRDAPDRPQRGLVLDIARKHFPAEWIEDQLHLMADLKLNQLQLHFSDDQGFRIESDEFPEIVAEEHLTKDEVRGLVELARSLHIEVIPEIDSPGHLGAVLNAYPEFQLHRPDGEPVSGAIDISQPDAGKLIDDLLAEYVPLFPGTYFHLGGDEYGAMYASDPEASYPQLAAAARDQHGPAAGVQDLATSWLNDRAAAVRELDRVPQVWNDGMHAGGVVAPDTERQVHYWTGREYGARPPEEYLEGGWQLINSSSEYLYYVLGEPNEFVYPTGERIYHEWTPEVVRGDQPVAKELGGPDRIVGGRFAVWCDLADAQTPEEVAAGIRMPLHATTQKLWNPAEPPLEWPEFTALAEKLQAGRQG